MARGPSLETTKTEDDLVSLLRLLATTKNDKGGQLDQLIYHLWPSAASRFKENWGNHGWNYSSLLSTDLGCYCARCDTFLGICQGGALRSTCHNCFNSNLATNDWRYHILLVVANTPFQPLYCSLVDAHRNKNHGTSIVQGLSK